MKKSNLVILSCLIFFLFQNCKPKGPGPGPVTPPTVQKIFPPGTVIANSKKSTRIFVGSPSIVIMPNGDYIVSHDESGPNTLGYPNRTIVRKSTDKGKTWKLLSSVTDGQTWSNIFLHKNELYIMGTFAADQRCLIRKSTDGGVTWSLPTTTSNGILMSGAYHTGPVPVVLHNNRIWRGMEAKNTNSAWDIWPKKYNAMMMSASADADLLLASSWTKSNQLPYADYLNGNFNGWLEGNAVLGRNNKMKLVMRVDVPGSVGEYIAIIDVADDGKTITFDKNTGFVKMPGGAKKFTIRYDEKSDRYWTLSNFVDEKNSYLTPGFVRNTLTLISSPDLKTWTVHKRVLEADDTKFTAWQYVDWLAEGDDMVFVSRTAFPDDIGGADTYHNTNYITFHRIEKFRDLVSTVLK